MKHARVVFRIGRSLALSPPVDGKRNKIRGFSRIEFSETLGNFYKGLETVLSGMLVAPEFLYFVERTERDPDHRGQQRLDAYSKALRLSLLLWNSAPDDALLEAAHLAG